MNNLKYSFSENDVKAITAALEILPSYDFVSENKIDMFSILCASAGSKLIFHNQLTNREMYVVALAIDSAYKALRNELSICPEESNVIRDYMFVYNKLQPIFSPLLDN